MAGNAGERTERATPKRRRDERRKGNVFMSRDIITLVSLLAVFYTLQIVGSYVLQALLRGIEFFWTEAGSITQLGPAYLRTTFIRCIVVFGIAAMPTLLVAGLVAIIVTFAQTRGLFASEKLKPKFGKLSPLKGLKKLFSIRGLVELLKSLLKIIILGYVVYTKFEERLFDLPRLMDMEFISALAYAGEFIMDIVTSVAVVFAFLAAADYMYQRWQYEKDMRMTKEEVKQEYKMTEGNPQIKSKIRQKQREMSMSRMMQQVPQADVIIRNPTHYAVAVNYEAGKHRAPVVLAKGADLLALRIIKVGEENNITVVENRPLARGLYENVPLDREIPEQFFQPVAEVLSFVYSTAKKSKLPKRKPN